MPYARILCLAFIASSALSQATFAKTTAQPKTDPSLVWQFMRFKDAAANNVDTAQLVYGIPETDAIEAAASCSARNPGKVELNLSADVGHQPDKSKVTAQLFGQSMNASIIIPESGEGQVGFGVSLATGDGILSKLASRPSLTYAIKDGAERTIPLSKGKANIGKFLRVCKSFSGQH